MVQHLLKNLTKYWLAVGYHKFFHLYTVWLSRCKSNVIDIDSDGFQHGKEDLAIFVGDFGAVLGASSQTGWEFVI